VILAPDPLLCFNARVFEHNGRERALLSQYGGEHPRQRGKNAMNLAMTPTISFGDLGLNLTKTGSFFRKGTSSRALRPVHGGCVNSVAPSAAFASGAAFTSGASGILRAFSFVSKSSVCGVRASSRLEGGR